AIQTLREDLRQIREDDDRLGQEISDLSPNKRLLRKLTTEITREQTRIKALEDELENPINVHRWRKLEGSNPKAFEMIQLLHTLQKNLISKTKEVKEKETLIQQKEELYLHLKAVMAKQVGPEAIEQVEEFQRILKEKNVQLKHMNVELNMYHSQVKEYKYALDGLNRALKQVKDDYFEMKKSGRGVPKLPQKSAPKSDFKLPPISLSQNSIVAAAADGPVVTESAEVSEGVEIETSIPTVTEEVTEVTSLPVGATAEALEESTIVTLTDTSGENGLGAQESSGTVEPSRSEVIEGGQEEESVPIS
ncbi:hypothetical protein HDU99_005685, partial [Rhizoclosmatium hyalinum]